MTRTELSFDLLFENIIVWGFGNVIVWELKQNGKYTKIFAI